jgi:hypothetical protein
MAKSSNPIKSSTSESDRQPRELSPLARGSRKSSAASPHFKKTLQSSPPTKQPTLKKQAHPASLPPNQENRSKFYFRSTLKNTVFATQVPSCGISRVGQWYAICLASLRPVGDVFESLTTGKALAPLNVDSLSPIFSA